MKRVRGRLLLLLCGLFIYGTIIYVQMENKADRFMHRLQVELLDPYVSGDPAFMVQDVMSIANKEGIELQEDNVKAAIVDPDSMSTFAAAHAINYKAIGDVVAINVKFSLKHGFITRSYNRTVDKALEEIMDSATRSSPGFPAGVNVPVPARNPQSYRNEIKDKIMGQGD